MHCCHWVVVSEFLTAVALRSFVWKAFTDHEWRSSILPKREVVTLPSSDQNRSHRRVPDNLILMSNRVTCLLTIKSDIVNRIPGVRWIRVVCIKSDQVYNISIRCRLYLSVIEIRTVGNITRRGLIELLVNVVGLISVLSCP